MIRGPAALIRHASGNSMLGALAAKAFPFDLRAGNVSVALNFVELEAGSDFDRARGTAGELPLTNDVHGGRLVNVHLQDEMGMVMCVSMGGYSVSSLCLINVI